MSYSYIYIATDIKESLMGVIIKDYSLYVGLLDAISEENLNTSTVFYNVDDPNAEAKL